MKATSREIFVIILTFTSNLAIACNKFVPSKAADPILIIHGGAGTISQPRAEAKKIGMVSSIRAGFQILLDSDNPMDAVEAAIHIMDNLPAFNTGYGSVLTDTGEIEMDALIINGTDLSAGAIGAMRHVLHPISVARFVLNSTRHVFLVGESAEKFAASKGIPLVPTSDLISNESMSASAPSAFSFLQGDSKDVEYKRRKRSSYDDVGTVGAVAINSKGQIAAATSTGGLSGKMDGRVGDSPIVGAGTFADDEIAGISGTGTGETFIRYRVASRIAELIANGVPPSDAILQVLNGMSSKIGEGEGGCIAITKDGQIGYQWNSQQMGWAYVRKSEMQIHYGVNKGEDFTRPFDNSVKGRLDYL